MTPYFSPAKVNLFFEVLRKRDDGYHEIASLYQAISLGDTLHVAIAEADCLTCTDLRLVSDSNLVCKARDLFRKKTGWMQSLAFHLEKRVPIEAGLGGGSSNAATALWAMNALCGNVASESDLFEWSKELGSDVPFFFSKGTAHCTGRGERIEQRQMEKENTFWIAKPKFGLSTALVYQHCEPGIKNSAMYFNDLEKSAFLLKPELQQIKTSLSELGFDFVVMTGSGTAFSCFGNVKKPRLDTVDFFPVHFINRRKDFWYEQ